MFRSPGGAREVSDEVLAALARGTEGIFRVEGGLTAPAIWPVVLPAVTLYALHHALDKSALFLGAGVISERGGRYRPAHDALAPPRSAHARLGRGRRSHRALGGLGDPGTLLSAAWPLARALVLAGVVVRARVRAPSSPPGGVLVWLERLAARTIRLCVRRRLVEERQ